MIKMGKMQEIKEFLEKGKTVKELVDLGFKKPSIYKVKKQLKDVETDTNTDDELNTSPGPGEVAENTQEDIDTKPDNTITDTDNNIDNSEEKEELDTGGIEEEIFGDEDTPFREFTGVDIRRDVVDILPGTVISGKSKAVQTEKGTGKIELAELLTEVFNTIGIVSGHDFWELSNKEQKVIKHLCRIPGLEKFLHKFGLYGCVIGLFTITFKRIKKEIQIKKGNEEEFVEKEPPVQQIVRPDTPEHVLAGMI
jgi:hypothetical protein